MRLNFVLRAAISVAATVYLLAIANFLPEGLAQEFIKAFSLAQIIAAFLSFGGRQRILYKYSGHIAPNGGPDAGALGEVAAFILLGVVGFAVLSMGAIVTLREPVSIMILVFALMISIAELIFHTYLSIRKVSGFPINYGITLRLLHVLTLYLLTASLEISVSVEVAIGILVTGYAVLCVLEWVRFRHCITLPSLRGIPPLAQASYAYWLSALVSISFLNIPQYHISNVGSISDINFYRILIGGPLLASLIVQVYLPYMSHRLRGAAETCRPMAIRSLLLASWLVVSIGVTAVSLSAYLLFLWLGLIAVPEAVWWIVLIFFAFSASGSIVMVVGGFGSFRQPTLLIFGQVAIKLVALAWISFGARILDTLLIAHISMSVWTLLVLATFHLRRSSLPTLN